MATQTRWQYPTPPLLPPRIPSVGHRTGWTGGAVVAAAATLLAETFVAGVGLVLFALTQEESGGYGGVLFVLVIPLSAVVVGLLCLFMTVVLVLPAVSLARWAADRWSPAGKRTWWWVLVAVPVVSAVPVLAAGGIRAAAGGSAGAPMGYVWWWLALAVTTVPAALSGWNAPRRTERLGGLRLGLRALAVGAVAALVLAVLGAVAFKTGVLKLYEPPRLSHAEVVGAWRDGKGGTLELAGDGRATARGLDDGRSDDDRRDAGWGRCEGTGTWKIDAGGKYGSDVVLRILDGCRIEDRWRIRGTDEHPTLVIDVGDPDEGRTYTLTRGDRQA